MLTAWWQSESSRKGRLAELELQLQHERILRDENARRSAMLELAYTLRRFENCTVEAILPHAAKNITDEHPHKDCKIGDTLELVNLGNQLFDLVDKDGVLLDDKTRNDLEVARDAWDELITYKRHLGVWHLKHYGIDKKEHCAIGTDLACMELILLDANR